MKAKVLSIGSDYITFEDGWRVESYHSQNCCENHYLSFSDLSLMDFDGLEFDLTSESFFSRIEGYGIELVPLQGWPVKVPGYGYNNGYYSSSIDLLVTRNGETVAMYDVSECQNYEQY